MSFLVDEMSFDMAEEVGFEPTEEQSPSLDFESSAFDRSATPPRRGLIIPTGQWFCKPSHLSMRLSQE